MIIMEFTIIILKSITKLDANSFNLIKNQIPMIKYSS